MEFVHLATGRYWIAGQIAFKNGLTSSFGFVRPQLAVLRNRPPGLARHGGVNAGNNKFGRREDDAGDADEQLYFRRVSSMYITRLLPTAPQRLRGFSSRRARQAPIRLEYRHADHIFVGFHHQQLLTSPSLYALRYLRRALRSRRGNH